MKVAYNGCYGGFTLSKAGVLLAREISGDKNWGGACLKGDKYECGAVCDMDYGYRADDDKRACSVLIEVIEKLGSKEASGSCSELRIQEIPDGADFEIDEYDGYESVERPRPSW